MSIQDDGPGTVSGPVLNAGQNLVAMYRAERLRQRPTLQIDLRAQRAALRQGRIDRLGAGGGTASSRVSPAECHPIPVVDTPGGILPLDNEPSIFAKFVGDAPRPLEVEARDCIAEPTAILEPPALGEPEVFVEPSVKPDHVNGSSVANSRAGDTALADIGFGPGMVLRFSQLGIANAADLARADAINLRDSLGDISRLINVEFWIESARRACSEA